jgi:Dyp-type peroxidase family
MSDPAEGPDDPDALEPILPLDYVQGNILPGFNKRHQRVVGFRVVDVPAAKRWFACAAPEITTATEVQRYKDLRRALRARRGTAPTGLASVWMAIAFSAPALRRLVSDADVDLFEDEAFHVGLHARASTLGDPDAGSGIRGSPDLWEFGGTETTTADVLLILAADREDMLQFHWRRVDESIAAAGDGLELMFEQDGADLEGPLRGHEHFGFRDGISQPGIRGRLPWDPEAFLTPRVLAPEDPDFGAFARPGQPLVRAGQFLFGYATQDRLVPEAPERVRDAPPWARNGSFLVFRRLEQDVAAFRAFVATATSQLATHADLVGLTEQQLAALIVGRWPSGAPLMRTPEGDDARLADGLHANAFRFDGAEPVHAFLPGNEDPFPPAPADRSGVRCPIWAHVRKVNPRDITTEQGSDTDTLARRLLRRGIPFGTEFDADDADGPRGLLFVSYQTSITDQFEFLASSWMNTKSKPQHNDADGHDLLVGQNRATGEGRVLRAALPTVNQGAATTHPFSTGTGPPWIFATGGGYFFAPSPSALTDVIAA